MTEPTTANAGRSFAFDNTYARELPGFFAPWQADPVSQPRLVKLNRELARDLDLDVEALDSEAGAAIFAGNVTPEGAETLAQAYAGHQFGGFVPQLGDGRALLLGEHVDPRGKRWDIQLKGSGRTPFSRGGDGRAALGPVLREYLIAEAMHALRIPTTRALAAVTTNDPVYREEALPGAILTRVAASHIRIGTFQFFAARGETERVRQLADYALARHYPELCRDPNPYRSLLHAVCQRQAQLVARWMHVGFIHGVMNTDNMAISGETIDYGPCAFMDVYDPKTVFSSIDAGGRYAYGNQPLIARWNLARFAETLLPLLADVEEQALELAGAEIDAFADTYVGYWLEGMRAKLGLSTQREEDLALANDLLSAMEGERVDYTQAFRLLADVVAGEPTAVAELFDDPRGFEQWWARWQDRLSLEPLDRQERARAMRRVNPLYIPRNHLVEAALQQALAGNDYSRFESLLEVLTSPFEERPGLAEYAQPGPRGGPPYRTFCGT